MEIETLIDQLKELQNEAEAFDRLSSNCNWGVKTIIRMYEEGWYEIEIQYGNGLNYTTQINGIEEVETFLRYISIGAKVLGCIEM